jgi:hypothetical protein
MRKMMMLALRQTLTVSRTTQLVPDTRAAACLPALPRAAPAVERTTQSKFLSRVARGLLVGTAALFLCLSVSNARADEVAVKGSWTHTERDINIDDDNNDDDDYDYIDHYVNSKDSNQFLVVFHFKDGTVSTYEGKYKGDSNPNPEDPNSGPGGDLSSLIAGAKQKGGGKLFKGGDFWKSPLGQRLSAGGNGPGPVVNPSDDGVGQGGQRNPSLGKEKLGGPQIFNKYGQAGSGKGGGFQFDGGSPGDQLKTHGPGGHPGSTGGGGGDDKGSHKPPPGSNFGPVELVDPLGPPIARVVANGTGKGITNIAAGVRRIGAVQGFGARPHYKLNNVTMRKYLGGPDTKVPRVGKLSAMAFHARGNPNKMSGPALRFVRR